ncbi:phospholipase A1-Ibeta2, chloroplastic-like [Phalaenopsis equestris]|uniref:phospholipase A1-Ibeta2, chloroplastic-like n=1 Tax=Phalaenopsis equestris TaxID=78828 RepID=UPI0009E539E4|nr:phospholipase A1-Ibeta2, chloroplastic-like [Phalaenopsis equestris]
MHVAAATTLLPPPQTLFPSDLSSRYISRLKSIPTNLLLPSLPFPQPSPEEPASPRSLAHLRHLLSDSSHHPSPHRPIPTRWRELHGSSDWSGLLDPLDSDLRRELLRYGDFIHSAYEAFLHPPTGAATHDARTVLFPDPSYRLTRHLFATASFNLPPSWPSHGSSWIGFVAVCDNEREIRRMGRRDILIALRGTSTFLEWAENLRANLVPLASPNLKVECGFRNLYHSPGVRVPSLSAAVSEEIQRLAELYRYEELSITVTGHSLGAALALLVANDLITTCSNMSKSPPVAVFSFGGPRVGNRAFAESVERRGVKVLRVVNKHDLVTKIPGEFGGWWEGYEHVGRELRVDSRVSPFLKPNADPGCCHDLEAYLHLVDGLGGGKGCEFRTDAKRSLVRLLSHQRGNMKKLYVSEASALGAVPGASAYSGCFASLFS